MPIRVALHHKTSYSYDRLVHLSPQVIRLRPAPHSRTPVTAYSLKIEPKGHFLNWQQDPLSNYLARVVFPERVRHFTVEVDLVAELTVINPFDFFLEPYAEKFPFKYEAGLEHELTPFLAVKPAGPQLAAFLKTIDRSPKAMIDFLVGLNQKLQQGIRYVIRMEPGVQSSEETLELASGSCRDSAWLLVEALRHLGLAARFVSGFLIQLKPDITALDGAPGADRDFTDLHAWTEVYLPGAGWVGMDPTSGLFAGEGHIPLAATPEPSSAAPVSGNVDPCEVTFAHEMAVWRVMEDPRVTLPYTEEQWERILALGCQVDREICDGDIRLTMGGRAYLRFDRQHGGGGVEYGCSGSGEAETRGRVAGAAARAVCSGRLLHYGQGKWYPGEPLPRWALGCYWRKDGTPLWRDRELLARDDVDYGFGVAEAKTFAETLARRLGLNPDYVAPAFEDQFYHLHQERALPVNVEAKDNRLEDPLERERIRKVFERGLDTPVGMVLPLQSGERERSGKRGCGGCAGEHLFLLPGDSPVGLRLPLPSLPWVDPEDIPEVHAPDPTVALGPLPVPVYGDAADESRRAASGDATACRRWASRLLGSCGGRCASSRAGGRMCIFMPPVDSAEDYVDLLAALEDTAAHLKMPVVIEGYTPPHDARIENIKVTPDPGVIEVNVHPARNWQELVDNTTAIYEDARQMRLGTEKFMLDGRHTGTGGGNHFVLGAATPADSPFLRRPDLLRSMIGYWLNHPALSYLFSSMFIGPTSQAPRVDETRADNLYELEIAFGLIPDPGKGEFRLGWWIGFSGTSWWI